MSTLHRYARLAVATLLVATVAAVGPSGGSSGVAAAASSAAATKSPVQLLSQSPWVEDEGYFHLEVQLPATDSGDSVQVSVFHRLVSRTAFQNAESSPIQVFYNPVVPLESLSPDSAGDYDINVPVNQAEPSGGHFPELPIGETGVFPLQVSVVSSSGVVQGSPLTTFIVFASGPAATTGYQPLSTALVVPFSTPVAVKDGKVEPPSSSESQRLHNLAGALAADPTTVHASLLASPLTVGALATSAAPTDKSTAEILRGVPSGGLIQLLPSTYSPAALAPLVDASLQSEIGTQLRAGSTELTSAFGTAPTAGVWVDDGPLDQATLGVLVGDKVTHLVVPSSDLAALPEYATNTTFASPTTLYYGKTAVTVMAADDAITGDFDRDEPPVQAANVLLAELAMIQTEEPGVAGRGVVVMPPANWTASSAFVTTLLHGLQDNPLLSATTVSGLFQAVGHPELVRDLAPSGTGSSAGQSGQNGATTAGGSPTPALDAASILAARGQVQALVALTPAQRAENASLEKQLLVAESGLVDGSTRQELLGAIAAAAAKAAHQITLPSSNSITLTATKGRLPLTILNAASGKPEIELVLSSQRLIFRAYAPPGGTCRVPTPTNEVCDITLMDQNTTLSIPVETRSSGVFPLSVVVYTAGGGLLLAQEQDTVRSTAVSQVAIALMVLAVLSLALWWGRDLRKGRRPASLVPSPDSEEGAPPDQVSRPETAPTPAPDVTIGPDQRSKLSDAKPMTSGRSAGPPEAGTHFRKD